MVSHFTMISMRLLLLLSATLTVQWTQPPSSWTCTYGRYGSYYPNDPSSSKSTECNCECGAWDPDCDSDAKWTKLTGCSGEDGDPTGNTCLQPDGTCGIRPDLPPSWQCSPMLFFNDSVCNCECGAWDPACDNPENPIEGCNSVYDGEVECQKPDGTCSYPGIPEEYECWAGSYNSSAFQSVFSCDCSCGAWDPDCNKTVADGLLRVSGCHIYSADYITPELRGCVWPGECDYKEVKVSWRYRRTPGMPAFRTELGTVTPTYADDPTMGPAHPGGRAATPVVVMKDQETGRAVIWLYGGSTRGDLWKYSPALSKWEFVNTQRDKSGVQVQTQSTFASRNDDEETFPGSREMHGLIALGDGIRLRLFAGEGPRLDLYMQMTLQDLWDYDTLTNSWTFHSLGPGSEMWGDLDNDCVTCQCTDRCPTPLAYPSSRRMPAFWAVGNDAFMYGGDDSRPLEVRRRVWQFSDLTTSWAVFSTQGDIPGEHEVQWMSFWKEEAEDGANPRLFVFGGSHWNNAGSTVCHQRVNTLHALDLDEMVWRLLSSPPMCAGDGEPCSEYWCPEYDEATQYPGGRIFAAGAWVSGASNEWDEAGIGILFGGEGWSIKDGVDEGSLGDIWIWKPSHPEWKSTCSTASRMEHRLDQMPYAAHVGASPGSTVFHSLAVIGSSVILFGGSSTYGGYLRASMWELFIPCEDPSRCTVYCADYVDRADPRVCSGHGLCEEHAGPCVCDPGWTGEFCGVLACLGGIGLTNESLCSGHGICDRPLGPCVCDQDWYGDTNATCDQFGCADGVKASSPQSCNGHGFCESPGGSCICENTYTSSPDLGCQSTMVVEVVSLAVGGTVGVGLLVAFVVAVAIVVVARRRSRRLSESYLHLMEDMSFQESTTPLDFGLNPEVFSIPWQTIRFEKIIGRGGSGAVVHLVRYGGAPAAVKLIRIGEFTTQTEIDQFTKELVLLKSLQHPAIIVFYGATARLPMIGLVMEYCEHQSVRHVCLLHLHFLTSRQYVRRMIERGTPLRLEGKIQLLVQIAEAMRFLHSMHVIHRDVRRFRQPHTISVEI